jgi:iron complex outermembrane receptor protein
LSQDSDFLLRYAYSLDEGSESFIHPGGGTPYLYDPWGGKGQRHEIEAQHNTRLAESVRLAWGGSWREDSVSAPTTLINQGVVKREVGRVFGNFELKPTQWVTGNLGLSWEEDSLAGSHFAPRASLAFHLDPRNTVRIGTSRAYRTGSVVDYRGDWHNGAKYQFRGDPDMPAERMDTWEIGYIGDWRDWRMSLDVRLFDEKVHNRLLVIDRDDSKDSIPDAMTAIQDVHMRGIEYQLKWNPFESTKIVLNQMFMDADAEFVPSALANRTNSLWNDGNNYEKRRNIDALSERGMPRRSTSLLWLQKLPWNLEFSAAGYWQDKAKWSINTWAERYQRIDTRLAYKFRWSGVGGELAWIIQSLNGAHFEYKAYNDPADRIVERRQWLTLRLEY